MLVDEDERGSRYTRLLEFLETDVSVSYELSFSPFEKTGCVVVWRVV